ncbi:MAG: glycosyltransferase [Erythrobacter sp.]
MPHFVFGIPFISEQVSRNFAESCTMLAATLDSCLRQTDQNNVHIVVVHHDMPDEIRAAFPTVEFVEAPFGPPATWASKSAWRMDHVMKTRIAAQRLRELGQGHFMRVDADDIIARNIVERVRSHEEGTSVLFESGYLVHLSGRAYQIMPEDTGHTLDDACGTCLAVYLSGKDLPPSFEVFSTAHLYNLLGGHKTWGGDLRRQGRKLFRDNSPAVGYVRHHSSNVTSFDDQGNFQESFADWSIKQPGWRPLSEFNDPNFTLPSFWLDPTSADPS